MTRIEIAYSGMRDILADDPEYAWAWHCNIAMPIMDEFGCAHEAANRAAARLMNHLFEIDITQHPHFVGFELQWKSE